jgi:hypothetical protein
MTGTATAAPRTPARTPAQRARAVAFYAVAGLATALTAFLTVGSVLGLLESTGPDNRIAFLTHLPWLALGYCAAFAALLYRPGARPAAWQQAAANALAMYLGGLVLAQESDPVFYVGFGTVLLLLALLHPDRRSLFRPGPAGLSPLLVPMALVAAAPLALYATRLLELHEGSGPDDAFYLGIAVSALSVPLIGLVAGLRAGGARLALWTAGVTLGVIGAASLIEPEGAAAMPAWAAALALAGAVAFVAVGEWERRRRPTLDRPAGQPTR